MSLLLLFHGAAGVAFVPKNEHYTQWTAGPPSRFNKALVLGLSAAIATTTLGNMPERVPDRQFVNGWQSRFSEPVPVNLGKKLNAALLDSGFKPIMPPRVPEREFQDGWRHRWTDPPAQLVRVLSTAANSTGWMPAMPIRVPDVQFQDGWRNLWQGSPAQLAARRATNLLESWSYPEYPPVVAAAAYTDLVWSQWDRPASYLAARRSVGLLGAIAWAPPLQVQYAVSNQQHRYSPAQRSPELLTGWSWHVARVPETEYQDGWRCRWQEPPAQLQPRRAVNLLESWAWPGYGYSFVQVAPLPTDWWFTRFTEPPAYSRTRPRAADLSGKGGVVHGRVPDREFQDGWRSAFSQPPIYGRPKPRLAGEIVRGRVPDREFQEGWRAQFSQPQRLSPRPRQQGYIAWPGVSFSFVVQTATDFDAFTKWQEPPHALQAKRSVALFGQFGWDPQVVVQITPPVAEPGVCVSFSYKKAPRITKGLRTGPTTQMVLARGSFNLSFGVKHQCEPPTTIIATVIHGEVALETETEVDLLTENRITLESES
jgi:hypothetical protein